MIGVVVIAHAPLAAALVSCAHHVYGQAPERCVAIDVIADTDPALDIARTAQAIAALDRGDGVLVMVDMFGATPGNVAASLSRPGKVEVVSGVNLPMLLRVLCYRESQTLATMLEKALAGGASGIIKLASTPPQEQQWPNPTTTNGGSQDGDARLQDQQ